MEMTPAEHERFESHHWAMRKSGGRNKFKEPIYQSVCTACGVLPSDIQSMVFCPYPKADSEHEASILDFRSARIRRRGSATL